MADISIPNYNFLSENPVKPVTEFANNVIQMQRNQLSLQDEQAQQAWGNVLAHNTGPDGTVNYKAATAEAAGNLVAARGMMRGLIGSTSLQGATQEQGIKANTAVANAVTAALGAPDDQLHDAVASQMQRLITLGVVPPQLGMTTLAKLPSDPTQLRAELERTRISLLPPQLQQENIYGPRRDVTAGGVTYTAVPMPTPSSGQPGPAVVHTIGPESGADLIERPTPLDAQGQPITLDPKTGAPTAPPVSWRIDRVPRSSLPGVLTPGAPGTGPQPPNLPAPGTKIPGAYQAPGGAAQPAQPAVAPSAPAATPPTPAAAPAPAAPAVTGMPLTTGAGLEASAAHAAAARDKANNYQQTIQPIEGALTALAGADTGKASETLNNLRGVIQDITPSFITRMMGNVTDPARRKAFDEANKYLTQMQLNAPGGARSDTGLQTAGAASPSVHISNAAAIEVGRAILAQRRMEQVGTMLFNQSGQPPGAYDQFMNKWATSVDPRAFVADKLNATERAQVIKDLGGTSSAAYQQYRQSYEDAVQADVIRH